LLFTAALLLSIANAANAATLSLTADKTTYTIGETVTLTVVGDDEGATAYSIVGRLVYNGALVDNGTRSQITLFGPYGAWTKFALTQADSGTASGTFSDAFQQVSGSSQTATNLPGVLSTVTLIAKAVGVVDVAWDNAPPPDYPLAFFGLTDAPGTSFTIVPEPATVALLVLGLAALAASRPRGATR
jgi:hypothetical protein